MKTPPTRGASAATRQQQQQLQQQQVGEQLHMLQLQRRNSGSGGAAAAASPPHPSITTTSTTSGYHIPASLHHSRSSSGTANWNSGSGNSYGVMSSNSNNNAVLGASMSDYAGFSISHYNSMLDHSGHNGTTYAVNNNGTIASTTAGPWDGGKGLGLMSHQNEVNNNNFCIITMHTTIHYHTVWCSAVMQLRNS
jgi:hypothetical protein